MLAFTFDNLIGNDLAILGGSDVRLIILFLGGIFWNSEVLIYLPVSRTTSIVREQVFSSDVEINSSHHIDTKVTLEFIVTKQTDHATSFCCSRLVKQISFQKLSFDYPRLRIRRIHVQGGTNS